MMPQTPPNKFSSAKEDALGARHKRQRPDNSPRTPQTCSKQQEEMMEILTKVLAEVTELRKSQAEMQKSLEFYIKNYEEINTKIIKLKEEQLHQNTYVLKLENRIDELERYNRSTCLEIRGIPSKPGETKQDLSAFVDKLHTKVRAQMHSNAIKDIYRINRKPSGERPIVIEFTTNLHKSTSLQAVKKYNATNSTNRLNTTTLDIEGDKLPIFVSEFLTPKAKRLYFLAREASKSLGYDFCWSANGRIFLRKAEGSPPIVIVSEKQLEDLKQKN